jgi:hypothetical protein
LGKSQVKRYELQFNITDESIHAQEQYYVSNAFTFGEKQDWFAF